MVTGSRQVHLDKIEIAGQPGRTYVRFTFLDNNSQKHVVVYSWAEFGPFLDLLMQRSQEQRHQGLRALGMYPGKDQQAHLWFINFRDGFIGNMGTTDGDGAVHHLQLLLHEQTEPARAFRLVAVGSRKPYVYPNRFHTNV